MVIRLDIGEYAGVKRWAYEQLGNFRKRASAKAKKKMKEEGVVSAVKLSKVDDIGWTAQYLKLPAKANYDNCAYDVFVINDGAPSPKYYYRYDEIILVMKLIDNKFTSADSDDSVLEYLTSDDLASKLEELVSRGVTNNELI
jgi:hypothetical protein